MAERCGDDAASDACCRLGSCGAAGGEEDAEERRRHEAVVSMSGNGTTREAVAHQSYLDGNLDRRRFWGHRSRGAAVQVHRAAPSDNHLRNLSGY